MLEVRTFLAGICGLTIASVACTARKPPRITELTVTEQSTSRTEDEEIAFSCLEKGIAEMEPGKSEQYRREDFALLSVHRILPREPLPSGGRILRGVASQSGVPESKRVLFAVTVFVLPGKLPAYVPSRIPPMVGFKERYHVYALGHQGRLLVVCGSGPDIRLSLVLQEKPTVGPNWGPTGSVDLVLWGTRRGQVERVGTWVGDGFQRCFYHGMRSTEGSPELVIHGFPSAESESPARENKRKAVEATLGIPVRFVYDGDHGLY